MSAGNPIQHGGDLARARALFPEAPEPWIDLSTGINPHSYPYSPLPANAFWRLPEPETVERVRLLAAKTYGAPSAAHVVAGPGTQILLPIVTGLVRSRSVAAILSPTYAEHARAAHLAGYEVREVGDLDALAEADLAVVVNPNNPTGRIIPKPELMDLAARMRAKGGLLVVDEAFHDVSSMDSFADAVDEGGSVVLRSFGKFYGMAGVRLGFAISRPDLISRMEERLGPWSVSGPALHIANEALADRAWQRDMRERLRRDAARLDALLAASGIPVAGGTSLFRYVQCPDAQTIFNVLGRRGVLIRKFDERPRDLRIGLPGDEGWERLQRAMEDLTS